MVNPETRLVHRMEKAVRARWPQAWILKVYGNPMQPSGVPDLLICVDGLLVGAEAKCRRPGESVEAAARRATPLQRIQIGLINTSGGIAAVVTSPEECVELVERGLRVRKGFASSP